VLKAIGDWARPQLAEVDESDAFQSHWLVLPLRFYGEDGAPADPPVRIQLEGDDEPVVIELGGRLEARVGRAPEPDLVVRGPARAVGRLMLGRTDAEEARKQGVAFEGPAELLERVRIRPPVDGPPAAGALPSAA
jgi:hypothetical protein